MDSYLLEQIKRHPACGPEDVIKMCYQASFGAEHLVVNKEMFCLCFEKEWAETEPTPEPLYEEISADFCRVNLGAWKYAGLPVQSLIDLFFKGTEALKPIPDRLAVFDAHMELYLATLKTVWPPEKTALLEQVLQAYRETGLSPIHHSEAYRIAENPHYRLIPTALVKGELHE